VVVIFLFTFPFGAGAEAAAAAACHPFFLEAIDLFFFLNGIFQVLVKGK
jgi:hypothetical protein